MKIAALQFLCELCCENYSTAKHYTFFIADADVGGMLHPHATPPSCAQVTVLE